MDKTTWDTLGHLAAGQSGYFSAAQAGRAGVGPAHLGAAVRSGRLERTRRGIYHVVGAPAGRWGPLVVVMLAGGEGTVISHSSAAALHGFEYGGHDWEEHLELTIPRPGRTVVSGAVVHRCPLTVADKVVKDGVRATSAPRTFVDLCGRLGPTLSGKLLDEGLVKRRWSLETVRSAWLRAPVKRSGHAWVGHLLSQRAGLHNADSILEVKLLKALRPLAPFQVHHVVEVNQRVFVVDVAWPGQMVAAEIVGRDHRVASYEAFHRERRKLNLLAAAGWRVAHLTAAMSSEEVLGCVRRLLCPG